MTVRLQFGKEATLTMTSTPELEETISASIWRASLLTGLRMVGHPTSIPVDPSPAAGASTPTPHAVWDIADVRGKDVLELGCDP